MPEEYEGWGTMAVLNRRMEKVERDRQRAAADKVLRDHFAAAALTGLLVHANDGIDEETLDTPSDIAYTAYAMADAMLRERGNHIPDAGQMVETPKEKTEIVRITERGWAGHFICCDRCRFRRNTLVECGSRRVVVSTVGAFYPRPDGGPDTIGHERHYETMAFAAVKENGYWEADVGSPYRFESPWSIHGVNDESDGAANDQHDAVVREIAALLAKNLDAAPAAIAEKNDGPPRERTRPDGTGDTRQSLSGSLPADLGDGVSPSENDKNLHHTQEIASYRRFVGEVMNWISEATGFLHDDVLRTDDARDIIHNACMRCWDAFDRIACPTVHGASPEARASVESVAPQPTAHADRNRTDKAAIRPGEGTGDTPDSPKPINDCVPDRSKPITGPDPDSRVWETPVHTPAPHATPGDGSVPREGTQEPVAWGVAGLGGILATSTSRTDAVDMQSEYEFVTEVIPLYRQAPDFAPPPPDNAAKAPDNAEPVAWAALHDDGDIAWIGYTPDGAADGACGRQIVPLYRSPTLTEAEREALVWAEDCADSQMKGQIAATIRGLLERTGGGG